jgi:hypothetical protein
VLIRTFIRHDQGHRNRYLRKSVESAIAAIESPALREHARLELAAAIEDASASPQVEDSGQDAYEDPYEVPIYHASEDAYEANYSLHPSTTTTTPPPNTAVESAETQAPSDPAGEGKSSSRRDDVIANYVRLGIDGMEQRGEAIKSTTGITRHFTEQCATNSNLNAWMALFPTAPADAIAAWLHGDKGSMRYFQRADEIAAAEDGPESATIHDFPRKDTA